MILRAMIVALVVMGFFSVNAYSQTTDIKTNRDTLAYSLGNNIGSMVLTNITTDSLNLNVDLLIEGIKDGIKKNQTRLSQEQMMGSLSAFQTEMQSKQQARMKVEQEKNAAAGSENKKKGEAFLAENAKKEGVKTLPSGLQYKVIKEGTGKTPKATDKVTVHYTGTLIDGKVFDSSVQRGEPATFPVNRVIKGWTEALQLMKEGSKWTLYIPSNLAYGEQGAGGAIGPNEVLIFDVELLKVESADGSTGSGK
jgi:FKBP-type peptidyl-prolyl cis-trans isomerase FklB